MDKTIHFALRIMEIENHTREQVVKIVALDRAKVTNREEILNNSLTLYYWTCAMQLYLSTLSFFNKLAQKLNLVEDNGEPCN